MTQTQTMRIFGLVLVLGTALALVLACGGGGGSSPAPPVDPPVPPPEPPPPEPPPPEPPPWDPLDPLAALRSVELDPFVTSPVCETCHSNEATATAMRDGASRPVAPHDLWRATAMASAGRDPFWRAAMAAEVLDNPTQRSAIESKCMACHVPMASRVATANGGSVTSELLNEDTTLSQVGLDGVSCTLCHQITEAGLGTEASYTAGFALTPDMEIYAEHANPNPGPMRNWSGYTPVQAVHPSRSALCATCHTVITQTLDAEGAPTGDDMPEQTPYLEWRNSVYTDEVGAPGPDAASCQACHTPSDDVDGNAIVTQIARRPPGGDFGPGAAPTRSTYHRHVFVGGNTLLPAILRDAAGDLHPNASADALTQVIADAAAQLQSRTASLGVRDVARDGASLGFTVRVENRAGHKLPTSYPSRRAWLRLRVRDAAGNVVLRVGEHDSAGRILGADGAPLASEAVGGPMVPHQTEIRTASDVQIYEPVMAAPDGSVTYGLMRAADYVKDNRLLPRGWSPTHAEAARVGPRGAAAQDPDFVGGRDDVRVVIDAPAAAGPYTVEASLLYQVLGARYAAELFARDTREGASFKRYYEAADRAPKPVASLDAALQE